MKHIRNYSFIIALLLLGVLSSCGRVTPPSYWPTKGWQSSTPEEQGVDSVKLAEGLLTIREKNLNLHSLLIIKNGKVIVDAYFYPYDGTTVHDLASVTKSVTTTLVGIAADLRLLRLDQAMTSFFVGHEIANLDEAKTSITVRHLASMTSGLESVGFERDEGTLKDMQASDDWVQFALDRKVIYEPGTHFIYDSPGMHLLSAILEHASGMTELEFAYRYLFEPLGIDIDDVRWDLDLQGFNHGWGDLYLHPRDAAKLGFLWLNKGVWDGTQLVSSEWVEASVKTQIKTGGDDDYGYGWWVLEDGNYAAIGRGGQRIQVWPQAGIILVMTGGGVDLDDIEPLLTPAFSETGEPLPANPEGVAQLNAAVTAVAQAPEAKPVPPLPQIAKTISGKTYTFEPNPLEIETVGFEFNDSAEAVMHIKTSGDDLADWPVALDGVYRLFPGDNDLPMGLRGTWVDDTTFGLEYDNIAGNDHTFLQLHFEGERVVLEAHETAHELGTTFEGKFANP